MPATRKKKSPGRSRGQRPRRQEPWLLVVQLDGAKLRRDGLDLSAFARAVSTGYAKSKVDVIDSTTLPELLSQLAERSERHRRYDVIIAIGHSNESGIRVAEDLFVGWDGFAGFLRPFSPRCLCLVACRAGRSTPMAHLFGALPTLQRVYASPVTATRIAGEVVVALAPLLLRKRRPKPEHVMFVQAGLLALARTQLWEWLRDEPDHPNAAIFDHAADLLDRALRGA